MKNMLFAIGVCAMAFPSFAQFSLGPTIGVHSSSTALSANGQGGIYTNTAWRAGAAAVIKCSKDLSLRPTSVYEVYDEMLRTVGLSCLGTYNMHIKGGGMFFIGAGPYLAITAGRSKFHIPGIKGMGVAKLMKPFLPGIAINAGCQLKKGFFAAIYYQRIMTDVLLPGVFDVPGQPSPSDLKMNYANYGLSVGYLFRLKQMHTATAAPVEQKR